MKKKWSDYTVEQLKRRLKRLGKKVSGNKLALVRRVAAACRKGSKKRKAVSCKRRKAPKKRRVIRRKRKAVRRRKKPIFSAAGKSYAQIRKIAKRYKLKQAGKKATVIARIRAHLSRKKRRR